MKFTDFKTIKLATPPGVGENPPTGNIFVWETVSGSTLTINWRDSAGDDHTLETGGTELPVTALGTSGTQTIDRNTSDKWTLTPASAVTIATSNFTDMQKAELQITNGGSYITHPSTWRWIATADYGSAGYDYAAAAASDSIDMLYLSYQSGKFYAEQKNFFAAPPAGIVWLNADTITGSNNDPIASWTDSSGNSNNATQSTEGYKPLLKTNYINGHRAVYFDGSDDFLSIPNFSASTVTFFIVFKNEADTPGGFWQMGTDGGTAGSWMPYSDGKIYESAGRSSRIDSVVTDAVLTDWNIYSVSSGTNYVLAMNNAQLSSTTGGTVEIPASPAIGRSNNSVYFKGHIAEMIAIPQVLTTSQTLTVYNYLARKYGL